MVIWNYTVWYRLRGLWETSVMADTDEEADQLLVILRQLIPPNRKEVRKQPDRSVQLDGAF
jgi:hypothetical protein